MSAAAERRCAPSRRQPSAEETRAREILAGAGAPLDETIRLAQALGDHHRFGLARRLLSLAWQADIQDPSVRRWVRHRRVLCTYQDPDLPAAERLTAALEMLAEEDDLARTRDQETLGLAGSIFKRRWEIEAQKVTLERSLSYYLRGHEQGPERDQGYTAINAAYVLDVLADLEQREAEAAGTRSDTAASRAARARAIREDLVVRLTELYGRWEAPEPPDWWFYATLIEAHFGLGRYAEATEWVRRGLEEARQLPQWQLRSTAEQLASLARLQDPVLRDASALDPREFGASDAGRVLSELLGGRVAGVYHAFIGRVGLALSGGGFRASLYHIGVLARLAELDVLRYVEVLSCVSGGSIVGAHYYLEVKRLLETVPDEEVTRKHYVDLVRRLAEDFLEGVQQNIRVRVAGSLFANLRMVLQSSYSRTMRAGELYEERLYSRVADGHGKQPRWITDLYVFPKGEGKDFRPGDANWRRHAKVPDLIINATTLNTGHNWQFTASWMGEPPASIDTAIDSNYRLRRMYYWEAPERHRCIRLGHAVAASACVPGIFEPLALDKLYPDLTVRLVDGGVHDNQGIVGLIENDCAVLLVSDASGQLRAASDPGSGPLGVSLRSSDVLATRVRAEQYDELKARKASGLLRGLMYVHLTRDLEEEPRDWIGCQDPRDELGASRHSVDGDGSVTRYGIRKDVQAKIAAMRTDLDSFSDAEAYALMASGYRMTDLAFREDPALRQIPHDDCREGDWPFHRVDAGLADAGEGARLDRLLSVSHRRVLKAWHLFPLWLKALFALPLGAAGALLAGAIYLTWDLALLRVSTVVTVTLPVALGAVVGGRVVGVARLAGRVRRIAIGLALAIVGWWIVPIHLATFDRAFLKMGRVPEGPGAERRSKQPAA